MWAVESHGSHGWSSVVDIQISKDVSDSAYDLPWPAAEQRAPDACSFCVATWATPLGGNAGGHWHGWKWMEIWMEIWMVWSKQNDQEKSQGINQHLCMHLPYDLVEHWSSHWSSLCIDSKPQAYAPFAIAKANGFPFRSESRKPSGSRASNHQGPWWNMMKHDGTVSNTNLQSFWILLYRTWLRDQGERKPAARARPRPFNFFPAKSHRCHRSMH